MGTWPSQILRRFSPYGYPLWGPKNGKNYPAGTNYILGIFPALVEILSKIADAVRSKIDLHLAKSEFSHISALFSELLRRLKSHFSFSVSTATHIRKYPCAFMIFIFMIYRKFGAKFPEFQRPHIRDVFQTKWPYRPPFSGRQFGNRFCELKRSNFSDISPKKWFFAPGIFGRKTPFWSI